jgi:hypothetical protein
LGFQYDYYKRIKPNRLTLANPQGNEIGVLTGVKEFKVKEYTNSIDEISFKIYEYEDGVRNDLYDLLEEMRQIKAQDLAVFQIKEINDVHGEDIPIGYKQIVCKSLENELIGKYIDGLDGVYSLWNTSDQSHSILHIVARNCSWTIGSVSSSLLQKYRMITVDSAKIYNFLTSDCSTSFGCIFKFDTINKIISAITLDELGIVTDIVISDKNVLKQYTKKSDLDKVITSMKIRGGTNQDGTVFDLRSVNPDSSSVLTNVNYYKVPINSTTNEGWMTQGLVDALNAYEIAYSNYSTQYTTALNTYKQYQAQLLTLQNQLSDINSQMSAQEQVTGSSVKLHYGRPPVSGESDYTTYQNAIAQINIINAQKVSKETEISNKKNQIASIQTTLNNIGVALNKSNYFTAAQLKELDSFITMGDEFSDETYSATDEMTQEEIIQMKLDLKASAELELAKICRPQYTIESSLNNLWTIQDGKDSKISYESWRNQLVCGNLITLKLRKDYSIQVRLMSVEYDFDNSESVNLIFSDKNRLDDELTQLGEIISQTQSSSKSFNANFHSFLNASKSTSDFNIFRTGSLTATNNQMKNDGKGEITFGEFGIKAKQVLSDGTIGSHQMWINPWRILMTDNSFESANTAIGLLTLPDGTQRMGINTDLIFGKLLMTENCYIENESGTYSFDKNGFVSESTIGANIYSVKINPSSPANIFNIAVNNISKLYVDVNTNRLVMNGEIQSTYGNIAGWSIGTSSLTSPSSRMKLSGSGMNLYNSSGSYLGGVASTASTNSGVVLVKSTAANYFAIATTSDTNPDDGMSVELNLLYTPNAITLDSTYYPSGFHFRLTNVYIDLADLHASGIYTSYINDISISNYATKSWVSDNYASSSEIYDLYTWVTANFEPKA